MRASHFPGCAEMSITVRPLTFGDVGSDAALSGARAHIEFCGMLLCGNLGNTTDTIFRVYVRHLPS
jgi:hypothetical protein